MPVDFRSTNVDIHINFNICIYTPAFIHRTTNIASTHCTCIFDPHLSGFSGYVVRDATPQRGLSSNEFHDHRRLTPFTSQNRDQQIFHQKNTKSTSQNLLG